jgi:predicted metalloprotease with PDZ domain
MMIKYELSIANAHRHFLQLDCLIPVSSNSIEVQLPVWRPGRYERGDFAKNIRAWQVYSAEGEVLK